MCTVPTMTPQETHYLPLSPQITWIRYWKKRRKYYSIIRLMPCLHSSYYPTFSTLFHSHNFSIFRFLSHSHCLCLCLSRASIVQKRVIYFQDEGSLTIRLCEKGNDSCPSSPHLPRWLLIFPTSAAHHSAIIPILSLSVFFFLFFYPFEAEQLSVFHTGVKSQQRQRWELWEQPITDLLVVCEQFKYSFEFCHRATHALLCYLFTAGKNAIADLRSCPLPKYTKLLRDSEITGLWVLMPRFIVQ